MTIETKHYQVKIEGTGAECTAGLVSAEESQKYLDAIDYGDIDLQDLEMTDDDNIFHGFSVYSGSATITVTEISGDNANEEISEEELWEVVKAFREQNLDQDKIKTTMKEGELLVAAHIGPQSFSTTYETIEHKDNCSVADNLFVGEVHTEECDPFSEVLVGSLYYITQEKQKQLAELCQLEIDENGIDKDDLASALFDAYDEDNKAVIEIVKSSIVNVLDNEPSGSDYEPTICIQTTEEVLFEGDI